MKFSISVSYIDESFISVIFYSNLEISLPVYPDNKLFHSVMPRNCAYVYSESFWKTVIKPLTVEMGDVSTGSTSHPQKAKIYCNVLQILAYQMYQRYSVL